MALPLASESWSARTDQDRGAMAGTAGAPGHLLACRAMGQSPVAAEGAVHT